MARGKLQQEGLRARQPAGTTWDQLAGMSPTEIRDRTLFPKGFYPLSHPNHPEGGMVFPKFQIEEIKKQEGRDLTRFDLGVRHSRSFPARVPSADVFDGAARL